MERRRTGALGCGEASPEEGGGEDRSAEEGGGDGWSSDGGGGGDG